MATEGEGIRRGSTKNLREMFERLTNETKSAEASSPTKNFSTLPRSFRQTTVSDTNLNSSSSSGSSSPRTAITSVRSIFEKPGSIPPSPTSSTSNSTTTTTTTTPTRVRRSFAPKAKTPGTTTIDQHISALTAAAKESQVSPLTIPGPPDGILHKPEQLLDTIRYLRDNQQRYQKCFSGNSEVNQVDQLKVQTLLHSSQMFMDLLEKQAKEVVGFLQQYHVFLQSVSPNTTSTSSTTPRSSETANSSTSSSSTSENHSNSTSHPSSGIDLGLRSGELSNIETVLNGLQ